MEVWLVWIEGYNDDYLPYSDVLHIASSEAKAIAWMEANPAHERPQVSGIPATYVLEPRVVDA